MTTPNGVSRMICSEFTPPRDLHYDVEYRIGITEHSWIRTES
jgi:hypothetical protein